MLQSDSDVNSVSSFLLNLYFKQRKNWMKLLGKNGLLRPYDLVNLAFNECISCLTLSLTNCWLLYYSTLPALSISIDKDGGKDERRRQREPSVDSHL